MEAVSRCCEFAAPRSMKRFWILVAIAGIAFVARPAYHFLMRPSHGDRAPPFSLPTIDGSTLSLESLRGRPVLVYFWATWCGICRKNFPTFSRMARAAAAEGVSVLAISEDGEGNDQMVESFLSTLAQAPPTVLLDREGTVADEYQSVGVPDSVLIDANGIIVWRRSGGIDWDDHDVRAMMRAAIKQSDDPIKR